MDFYKIGFCLFIIYYVVGISIVYYNAYTQGLKIDIFDHIYIWSFVGIAAVPAWFYLRNKKNIEKKNQESEVENG